jgi:hypothetical protein
MFLLVHLVVSLDLEEIFRDGNHTCFRWLELETPIASSCTLSFLVRFVGYLVLIPSTGARRLRWNP